MNSNGREIVISTPLRTAIGTFGGMLKETPASDLGAIVVKEILNRSGLAPDKVDAVIAGNCLPHGQGMNPGRQVGIKAGIPASAPAMTINRLCGSGLQAIILAAQEVALGTADVVVAGGIENMDMAPFMLPKARYGYRMGMPSVEMYDSMVMDGLWDAFNDYHMGVTAENVAKRCDVSREESDAYALQSHQRAAAAIREGLFDEQIVPVPVKVKKETVPFTQDEHVRMDTNTETMSRLKPIFQKDGTVTAGNASGINDGAGFAIVTTRETADRLGLPVVGTLVSYAVAGVEPDVMGLGPIPASRQALQRANLGVDDIDLFEVNEAFSSIAVAVGRELHIPDEKLNPLGGAIALGHPIGATGAILTVKILHELQRRGAQRGLVTLCIGGGMGIAAVFERA